MPEPNPNKETIEVNITLKSDELEFLDPNDLNVSIVIRKGIRTCIKHPLHLFLTLNNCPLTTKHLLQVHSRRKTPTTQFGQVQLPEPDPNKEIVEVNTTSKSDEIEIEIEIFDPNNLNVPIVIRKCIRTCTKHPLHLFLTYKQLFPNHKTLIANPNTISIPKTQSEALGDKNWKVFMKVKMEALEKNKT